MTPAQEAYVNNRARQIAYWPLLGSVLALLLLGLYAFLFSQFPLYMNPALLASKLSVDQVPVDTMARMAAMGNLAFLGCGAFILTLIGSVFAALWNERKLIAIIRSQQSEMDTLRPAPAAEAPAEAAGNDV